MVRNPVLHFHTLTNRAEAKAYFRSADYHFEGAEHGAYWLGKGADILGLHGPADPAHFEALIDNTHPFTGAKLTNARREDRDFARDMTVSLPKSVTLARTLGGDERITGATDRALAKMFAVMEKDASCRVRKKGADFDRPTQNLVACVFPHSTSRPMRTPVPVSVMHDATPQPSDMWSMQPDPQDHRHVVLLNLTSDAQEFGEWKAVQFRELIRDSQYYNAVFRAYLASELEGLGYSIRRTKDAFEIDGVPERTITEFSRRTAQIDKLADQLGIRNPESKAKLGATSRTRKEKGLTWQNLLDLWTARLQPGELDAIRDARTDTPTLHEPDIDRQAVSWSLAHLTERKSVLRDREVVREALRWGLGKGVTPEGVWAAMGGKGIIRRGEEVTTRKVAEEEKRIVRFAVQGRGKHKPLKGWQRGIKGSDPMKVGSDLTKPPHPDPATPAPLGQEANGTSPKSRLSLDDLDRSQRAVVEHVWSSPDRLMSFRGPAGSGKSKTLKPLLSGINVPWVVVAPTADASRNELRQDPFFSEADTLAKLLSDRDMQERVRGGLIVLDEAGQASTPDFAALCQLADSINARILAVGDRHQYKSVGRGHVLALLEDRANLPIPELKEVHRQLGDDFKEVSTLLKDGKAAEAYDRLEGMGWIKETATGDYAPLAEEYVSAVKRGRSVIAIALTHKEGEAMSEAIRDRLRDEGIIHGEEREFTRLVNTGWTGPERQDAKERGEPGVVFTRTGAYTQDTLKLAAGDTIRVTGPVKDYHGKQIDNGTVMTVTGFTPGNNIRARTATGIERLLPGDAGHFRYAYATGYGSQSKTVDEVVIAASRMSMPAVASEAAYVPVTRARSKATVFTDSPAMLRERWQIDHPHQHAFDLIRQPTKRVRKRLRKHISFLKEVAMRKWRDMTKQPNRELEMSYER